MAATSARTRSLVAVIVLAFVALAIVGLRFWRADAEGAWSRSFGMLPASTTVVGYTDWAGIRDLGLGRPEARAGDRDLLTRSVLADEAALEPALGWTTGDVDAEVYAQSPDAVALVVTPGESLGWGRITGTLADAGYNRGSDGIWTLSEQDRRELGLSDVFAFIRPLRSHGVVVLSPTAGGVSSVADTAAGERDALTSIRPALETASALSGAHTALMQGGSLACETTAMNDEEARRQAEVAQERSGQLATYTFSGRALTDRGGAIDDPQAQTARFAMTFDAVETARRQADVRSALARGPFIGRTGQVEDLVRLVDAGVDGATTTLTFDHTPEDGVLMVGTGPLLFASCP